jgi:hypothetical protein
MKKIGNLEEGVKSSRKDFEMSTKIYEAYRVNIIQEIFEVQEKMIKKIKEIAIHKFKEHAKRLNMDTWDYYTSVEEKVLTNKRRFEYYFDVRENNNKFYVIPHWSEELHMHIGGKDMTELFKLYKHWEDFRYWNNVDIPEDVTSQQWSVRSRIWNKVIDKPCAKFYVMNKDNFYICNPCWEE